MFGFVNGVDRVIWPLQRDLSADVSSISPSKDKFMGTCMLA